MFGDISSKIWGSMWDEVTKSAIDGMTFFLQLSVSLGIDFWSEPIIIELVRFSTWVGRVTFAGAFIAMLFDVMEDLTAEKSVRTSVVFSNFVKAFIFIEGAPILGKYSLTLLDRIISVMNFSADASAVAVAMPQVVGSMVLIGAAVTSIACIYFLYQALKCFGAMFVQIMTAFLYIPGILRGDTTAMGSWMRQTVAIALSFFFKYLCFYLALVYLVQGNIYLTITFWTVMAASDKILDKFGWSFGTGGNLSGAANLAMQGLQYLGA